MLQAHLSAPTPAHHPTCPAASSLFPRVPAAVQPRRMQLRERRMRKETRCSPHSAPHSLVAAHSSSGLQQFESSSSNGSSDGLRMIEPAQLDSLQLWDLMGEAAQQQQPAAGLQQYIQDNRPESTTRGSSSSSSTANNGGGPPTNGTQPTHSTAQSAAPVSPDTPEPKYKTVMLKVSGEALMGPHGFGVDPQVLLAVSEEVAAATQAGVRIAIVVGGGNFFRGAASLEGLERATGDYVGMLATVMNALCLQSALEKVGVETRVQTAIEMREVAEPYIRRRAISHLQAGRVVIFGAGTGNPFFTTDTAAALRAAEVNAEVFLKATKVDGVYDSDPFKNPNARRYDQLSYRQVCFDSLNVMDETAITLCKENSIPVIVFNIMEKGNIRKAALGLPVGTVVDNSPTPSPPQDVPGEQGAQSHSSVAHGAQASGVDGANGVGHGASVPAFQQ